MVLFGLDFAYQSDRLINNKALREWETNRKIPLSRKGNVKRRYQNIYGWHGLCLGLVNSMLDNCGEWLLPKCRLSFISSKKNKQ